MNDLARVSSGSALPIPGNPEVVAALESLQRALDAGVAIAKNREDGKTERALILAKKDVEIAAIEAQTRGAIEHDRMVHEERLSLIRSIGQLITENAKSLTPEIMEAARFLLDVLREEK